MVENILGYSSCNEWVNGSHLDTADALTINGGNLDISLLTPASAP